MNLFLLTRLDLSWLAQATAVPRPVSLAALAPRDWEANRTVSPRRADSARTPAAPPAVPLPEPRPQGQVVHAARPAEPPKSPPKDARFLAEFDSAVEKETRSRNVGLGDGGPATPKASPPGGPAGRPDARPEAGGARAQERRELAFHFEPRGELRRQRVLPEPAAPLDRAQPQATPGAPGPQGLPGADGSDRKLDLRPSAAAYQALGGGTPDKIDGVDEGEGTFLNTREWKYAGFFNRVGAQVYPSWVREFRSAAEARDPYGQRFLYKDRETVVNIRLDPAGKLIDVRVIQSSGAPFLDDAVVKAWRETQPFPNVPKGLLNERGEVTFAFSFTVFGVSGSPVQVFLGPNRY